MNKNISRKSFLKIIGSIFVGLLVVPFEKMFKQMTGVKRHTKEAKYYRYSDNLAG